MCVRARVWGWGGGYVFRRVMLTIPFMILALMLVVTEFMLRCPWKTMDKRNLLRWLGEGWEYGDPPPAYNVRPGNATSPEWDVAVPGMTPINTLPPAIQAAAIGAAVLNATLSKVRRNIGLIEKTFCPLRGQQSSEEFKGDSRCPLSKFKQATQNPTDGYTYGEIWTDFGTSHFAGWRRCAKMSFSRTQSAPFDTLQLIPCKHDACPHTGHWRFKSDADGDHLTIEHMQGFVDYLDPNSTCLADVQRRKSTSLCLMVSPEQYLPAQAPALRRLTSSPEVTRASTRFKFILEKCSSMGSYGWWRWMSRSGHLVWEQALVMPSNKTAAGVRRICMQANKTKHSVTLTECDERIIEQMFELASRRQLDPATAAAEPAGAEAWSRIPKAPKPIFNKLPLLPLDMETWSKRQRTARDLRLLQAREQILETRIRVVSGRLNVDTYRPVVVGSATKPMIPDNPMATGADRGASHHRRCPAVIPARRAALFYMDAGGNSVKSFRRQLEWWLYGWRKTGLSSAAAAFDIVLFRQPWAVEDELPAPCTCS